MIFVAGIVLAILLEFLLISKKEKTLADKILATWMFTLTCHLFIFYITYTKEIYNYPYLLGVGLLFPLLHALLLYLYVGTMTDQISRNKKVWALHLIPNITLFIYLFVTFFTQPSVDKIAFYETERPTFESFLVIEIIIDVIGMLYILWSGWLLIKHRRNILDQFSNLEKVNLWWLQLLTVGLGIVWLVPIFGFSHYYLFTAMAAFICLIGFFGLRQGTIFTTIYQEKISEEHEKYKKSSLTKEQSKNHLITLNEMMINDKPFLENKITLKELSDRLNIHPNLLSQVINENLNLNFYDFINSFRVKEFQKKLAEDTTRKFTLLAHAFDSGYNSKSSFNEGFKKSTGLTPSQFQKQLNR